MAKADSAPSFEPGDVVRLKSGSLPKTVESVAQIRGQTRVQCVWEENGTIKRELFPPQVLTKDK